MAVDDLENSLRFYRDGLGLPTDGIVGTEYEHGAVAFFHMNDDLILALYPRVSLANDANVPLTDCSPSDLSIGHTVGSKEEVDEIMDLALKAGAEIADGARERFWGGYSGYFKDPDGHLWEIAWNPGWETNTDLGADEIESSDATSEKHLILSLETAYDHAWNSAAVQALVALFTEDAVLVNPRGQSAQGRTEIENVFTDLLSGPGRGSNHSSKVLRVGFVSDEVAIVDGEAVLQGMRDEAGNLSDIFHSYTDIVVKENGRWMLAHVRGYFLDQASPDPQS